MWLTALLVISRCPLSAACCSWCPLTDSMRCQDFCCRHGVLLLYLCAQGVLSFQLRLGGEAPPARRRALADAALGCPACLSCQQAPARGRDGCRGTCAAAMARLKTCPLTVSTAVLFALYRNDQKCELCRIQGVEAYMCSNWSHSGLPRLNFCVISYNFLSYK